MTDNIVVMLNPINEEQHLSAPVTVVSLKSTTSAHTPNYAAITITM